MPELVDAVPARALAVYAHPDDPEVSCAGTLARWARAGSQVFLVICTRGDKGSRGEATDPEALALARTDEVAAASEVMGLAGVQTLGYPDGELENDLGLRAKLVEAIRGVRPDAVVCPDPTAVFFGSGYVNHHDHRAVGWAMLDACAPAAASPLYFPEAGEAHQVGVVYLSGTLEADVYVDIAASLESKVAALACHRTQVGDDDALIEELVRRRAEDAGRHAGVRYAEGFRRLVLGG
jgi:LmbE family N-acetylglucosaminyl deacetylase